MIFLNLSDDCFEENLSIHNDAGDYSVTICRQKKETMKETLNINNILANQMNFQTKLISIQLLCVNSTMSFSEGVLAVKENRNIV